VPLGWESFFISYFLNPSCFDWAKIFLSSEAWNIIINDAQGEPSVAFTLPEKCPSKRKLDCTISEIEEDVGIETYKQQSSDEVHDSFGQETVV
jgi:hypothetical protein